MRKIFKNNLFIKLLFVVFDFFTLIGSMYISLMLIDYGYFEKNYYDVLKYYSLLLVVIFILTYYAFGLYNSIWKYASIYEVINLTIANALVCSINLIVCNVSQIFPTRWCIIFSLFSIAMGCLVRFSYRFLRFFKKKITKEKNYRRKKIERVLIVGAGDAGEILIREMDQNPDLGMLPVCVIDDDKEKNNTRINGIKVVGDRNSISRAVEKYKVSLIIIAIPSASTEDVSKIFEICQTTKITTKLLSGLDIANSKKGLIGSIKDVEVHDLLGRPQIKINLDDIMGYVANKVCLVTGGGGSIGSELCRQLASYSPKQLIIFDIYENNAYAIEQELIRKYPSLNLLVLIGSVRDENKINNLFETYRPEIVYHAAAHKHVPLMEVSPNEAIKNNVFGTLNVAKAAGTFKTKRFILISTDKAVNPTNVMGATKRICEMIIQTMNKKFNTEFVAVRFGNVLGSNGSVIPLFKEQIKNGGPVTVTHKEITRFFMTIPEAVSLVLQAGAFAKGGEIFILDMGKPVKIYDLAVNLIRLSGFVPNVDIKIDIIGLRPGEKLYEEILMDEEGLQETANNLIHIGKPIELDENNLFCKLNVLYEAAYNETDDIRSLIHDLVDTYKIQ